MFSVLISHSKLKDDQMSYSRLKRAPAGGEREMPEIHVRESIVIKRKAGYIYTFWRNLENLPRFINHVASVEDLGEGHNRWTIKTPVGPLSWVSEITDDKLNQIIQWRSMPGSIIRNSGSLSLEEQDGGDATVTTVELRYSPPAAHDSFLEDKILEVITDTQLKDDLRKLKRIMESQT
jgi:uncharacterized membrane protein